MEQIPLATARYDPRIARRLMSLRRKCLGDMACVLATSGVEKSCAARVLLLGIRKEKDSKGFSLLSKLKSMRSLQQA
jgi:hypothetical protein